MFLNESAMSDPFRNLEKVGMDGAARWLGILSGESELDLISHFSSSPRLVALFFFLLCFSFCEFSIDVWYGPVLFCPSGQTMDADAITEAASLFV